MYDQNYRNGVSSSYDEEFDAKQGLNSFITKVFGWMFLGLSLTAGVAYYVSTNVMLMHSIYSNLLLYFGLIIGQLILVSVLSTKVYSLKSTTSIVLFLFYSVLNGLTLSVIFYAYTETSLFTTFAITGVTFGVMALYGYLTKADLTQFRTILFMGLIGVLILSVVNIFLANSTLDWIVSIIGLAVFLGLTAYDMQKLKAYYFGTDGSQALRENLAIVGALSLYLDFINLFLLILRFTGRRKN